MKSERKFAIRFVGLGLILLAIICMACSGTASDWNNFNTSVNNAVQLRHHEMHQNGQSHTHGNVGYNHHH